MTERGFFDAVKDSAELTWIGVQEGGPGEEDCVVVQSSKLQGARRAVPVSEIRKHPEQVLDCLMGNRTFDIMVHLSRIVGYYSRIKNWNRSKLAELKDRQKGRYAPEDVSHKEANILEKVA